MLLLVSVSSGFGYLQIRFKKKKLLSLGAVTLPQSSVAALIPLNSLLLICRTPVFYCKRRIKLRSVFFFWIFFLEISTRFIILSDSIDNINLMI